MSATPAYAPCVPTALCTRTQYFTGFCPPNYRRVPRRDGCNQCFNREQAPLNGASARVRHHPNRRHSRNRTTNKAVHTQVGLDKRPARCSNKDRKVPRRTRREARRQAPAKDIVSWQCPLRHAISHRLTMHEPLASRHADYLLLRRPAYRYMASLHPCRPSSLLFIPRLP